MISRQIALPVILGAAALKGVRLAHRGVPPEIARGMVAGAAAAFVSTLLSLRLITMLERGRSLRPYAAYRAAAGAGALAGRRAEARMSDAYAARRASTRARPAGRRTRCRRPRAHRHRAAEPLDRPPRATTRACSRWTSSPRIAICTDGVGTKLIVAEQAGRFDTVGIDCVAMNVNDLVCVGAEPIALVDYVAVEQADAACSPRSARACATGATQAASRSPGGELAQVPEMLRGHPSPARRRPGRHRDRRRARDRILTGERDRAGRRRDRRPVERPALQRLFARAPGAARARRPALDDAPPELGRPLADELLEPTAIYVRAALDLLRSDVPVHGLAHITGDGLLNLLRLNDAVGLRDRRPLRPSRSSA